MRGEVDTLKADGLVSARTAFPGGRTLSYAIESSPANVTLEAYFSDNALTVRIPETNVLAWAISEQVSISGEQLLDDGQSLHVLVEKDFACLAPREGEDESDMYPHPDAGSETC